MDVEQGLALIPIQRLLILSVASFFKGQPQWHALNLNTAYYRKYKLNKRRML